jgi:hypothetical protein
MQKVKFALPLLASLVWAPAQATLAPLLDPTLNSMSIFAATYVTTGVAAHVYGSFLAGAGATVGASSVTRSSLVTGNLLAVEGVTLGVGVTVGGNLLAGAGATVGASSTVGGNLLAGAGATLGADSAVAGSFEAVAAADLGARSNVAGNLYAGAAATLGEYSTVSGNVVAGTAVTLGVGAQVVGSTTAYTAPTLTGTGIPTAASVSAQATQIADAQTSLRDLAPTSTLAATMAGPTLLTAGIYSATALTMAAGTALVLDGQGLDNQLWVFNIRDYLVTGAGATISLINAGLGSSIIWNSGGYTTMGADTAFVGTILSNSYVSMGANTTVTGPNTSCGGIFSANSYVVMGADATVGSVGCSGASSAYWNAVNDANLQNQPTTLLAGYNVATAAAITPASGPFQVPEPATLWLVLASLAGIAVTSRRRRQ